MDAGFATDVCALPPTHPDENLTPMQERSRTLELAKYFAASQAVSASQAAIGDADIAAAPSAPAADTTLTALAQLGTFKLGCDRAFISLINSTHQYIIGEATQKTSLLDNDIRPEDGLCLGVRALELAFGVCPQTIQIFTSDHRTICTPNVHADKTRYVIKDFTADPQFQTRPYVSGWPHMRSYAEVPLKSASGYVVGSYCIVDTKPRDFGDSEIQVLESVGVTIMNHLELLKSQLELRRVQLLVRGIGSYAAGYASLQEQQTRPSLGNSISASTIQPLKNARSLPLRLNGERTEETTARPAIYRMHTDETVASQSDASFSTPADSGTAGHSGSAGAYEQRADAKSAPGQSTASTSSDNGDTAFFKAASAAVSRASHLIRQSMDLSGVVFVNPHSNASAHGSSFNIGTANRPDTESEGSNCEVIGQSVGTGSLEDNTSEGSEILLSHDLLKRLLERYPFGHVFSFDDLGAVLQPNSGKDWQARRHPSQSDLTFIAALTGPDEADDAAELRAAAEGARSIAFTTLWDYRNDKWFAASISWTTDPFRIFDVGELNYLSAFGNSITAEHSRLEVSALSKAKSDFISSISHEMRSPLHGILASTEILRDTMKLDSEVSMLNSIDACGSMLLDTINNLLDYSKITKLSKRRKGHTTEIRDGESKAPEFPVVNLSTLVQDVVDGVFLGHAASDNASTRETSDDIAFAKSLRQGQPGQVARKLTKTGDVVTVIDIDPSVDWRFRTEAAAWKRIVMNLFGNAMKFTQKGQITVKLHLTHGGSNDGNEAQHIYLEIHDTGSGINKDYLKSHLFTPFSQADDISVGTGVGLSIVKRLVEDLHGFIDVQSEDGLGTHVCVAVPLGEMTMPVNGLESLLHEETSLYANGRHKGHTLRIGSIALNSPEDENHKSTDPSAAVRNDVDSNVQTLLASLARHGFGMSVVEVLGDLQQSDASSHPISLNSSSSGGAWTLSRSARGDKDNALDGGSERNGGEHRTVVSIRQPFGPRTFASALDEIMAFTAADPETADAPAVTKADKNQETDIRPPSPPRASSPTAEGKHASSSASQDQHTSPATETSDTTAVPTQDPADSKPPAETPPNPSKTAPHLLLVDDNAINLKVLAASVKKGGCTYDTAADGREALEVFKSSPAAYDLVFMDLSMPVLDGIEATREIRALEAEGTGGRKRTQIIALTALDDDKHRQRAFEAGVDDFITKPAKMAMVRELARKAWDG